MAKVLGVGGIFFKADDPQKLADWYRDALAMELDQGYTGCTFTADMQPPGGATIWSPFAKDTEYFKPSDQTFMFNLMVDDLDGALAQVASQGGTLVGEPEDYDYGKFGWFLDPEGNKVELWQPKAAN